ncbi:MAG: carboxypeptidase-like regulatory domain-containing protein [Reichenbachiella sp.]|uniref:carboxypeptidase-like regulatory domain-containing protein n=3 Tax=Reichenbachiella sp. TaxID=2184521 RepID=UPI003264E946
MKYFILLFCILLTQMVLAQDLIKSRHTSHLTYIYKLSDKEAEKIYSTKEWEVDTSFFHTLVDSYPTDSTYRKNLPGGHYVRAYIYENQLKLDVLSIVDFFFEAFNNSADLQVKVFKKSGEVISDAQLMLGRKKLKFDSKTESYFIRKTNKQGLLKVTYQNQSAYSDVSRSLNNSRAKRLSAKVIYKTPLKYVWLPIRFVVKLPIDGVKSIVKNYPLGTISQTKYFFIKLYRKVACMFDEYHCDWYGNNYKFQRKYKGYFVYSQPKYLPGDTVKFKAFITEKGKPLNKAVDLVLRKGYNENIHIKTLKPTTKGAFDFQLALEDSLNLKLDKNYDIKLQKKEGKEYISKSFRYEEYELSKNNLELEVPTRKQYKGDTVLILASGKDENDLNLLDAKLEVLVVVEEISEYFDKYVFVPDTLSYFEIPLKPSGKTEISIPSEYFPKANLKYKAIVSLTTSDNERLTEKEEISYFHQEEIVSHRLSNDSIQFQFLQNGQSDLMPAFIFGMDAFGNEADSIAVDLPYTTKINSLYHKYLVKIDNRETAISLDNESSNLSFRTNRTKDSLFISTTNPRNIPFNYFIYKGNKEILRGQESKLQLERKINTGRPYHLSVQYVWGGRVKEENYKITSRKNILTVNLEAPPMIYPGQKVKMNVVVTDSYGKPVSNTDLLAHGLTKKFGFEPPELSTLIKPAKDRTLINTFNVNHRSATNKEMVYDYTFWNERARLDSIACFKFLFPGNDIYRYEYYPEDSITQFSPFVVKDGVLQPIDIVYVDHKPVYFSWSVDEPYSFRIDSGYHQVQIRTSPYQFEMDSVYFPFKKKLVFCFDQEKLPNSVTKSERKYYSLTENEKRNLYRYVVPYRNTFGPNLAYFRQGERFYPVLHNARARRSALTGPIYEGPLEFQLKGGYSHRFAHEPHFEYEIDSLLIKMRTIDLDKKLEHLPIRKAVIDFNSFAWTAKRIDDYWNEEIKNRRISSRTYLNPPKTRKGNGSLHLSIPDEQQTLPPALNTLMFKLDDPNFFRVYPRQNRFFEDLNEGWYKTIILYDVGEYAVVDSINIRKNGLNYHEIENLLITPKDTFGIRMNELMNQHFRQLSEFPLATSEKEALYKTYQRAFQFTGDGETVSGYIYDSQGEAVPGVTVVVKGTTFGTVSDMDGHYSLRVPSYSSELVFGFVGFVSEQIHIGARTSIDVTMTEDVQRLEEVVVIGYGVSSKSNLSAAVTSISGNDDALLGSLQGRVAGVSISSSAVPGSGTVINIRGNSSFSQSGKPLIIINGVPYLGDLESLDIEQSNLTEMKVLNPENAVAIYGARAANGILMITTKNGVSGMPMPNGKGAMLTDEFLASASSANSIRTNFSDAAFWEPRLKTDALGKASFDVTFPDDITKWETFVYATGAKRRAGQSQSEIKAFKPLSAQLNLPRFLLYGDSTWLIGKSLNYTFDSVLVKNVFEIDGEIQQARNSTFKDSYIDSLLLVPLSQDTIKAKYYLKREDGYFDGEERSIPVYPVGLEKRQGYNAALIGDTAVHWQFSPSNGPVTIYAHSNSLQLVKDKIEFLIEYKYGCNEQLASKLKAMLASRQLSEAIDVKESGDRKIRRIIQRLANNQNSNGLWGWWSTGSTEMWISLHVIEALESARNQGFKIPIDKTKLQDEAVWNLISSKPNELKINWLYISSLLDLKLDRLGFVNQLDSVADLEITERLKLNYIKLINRQPVDNTWVIDSLKSDLLGSLYLKARGNNQLAYAKESLKTTTWALKLLIEDTSVNRTTKDRIQNFLLAEMASKHYSNTYTTSNIVEVLASLNSRSKEQTELQLSISGDFAENVSTFPFEKEIDDISELKISKSGSTHVYMTAYQTVWETNPTNNMTNFSLETRFENGDHTLVAGKPEKLLVDLEMKHDADYVMIEVPIPAGCSYGSKKQMYGNESHREYFKEKVAVFYKHLSEGSHRFEIDLIPRYDGIYSLNPAKIELMYFPTINANVEMKKVRIN